MAQAAKLRGRRCILLFLELSLSKPDAHDLFVYRLPWRAIGGGGSTGTSRRYRISLQRQEWRRRRVPCTASPNTSSSSSSSGSTPPPASCAPHPHASSGAASWRTPDSNTASVSCASSLATSYPGQVYLPPSSHRRRRRASTTAASPCPSTSCPRSTGAGRSPTAATAYSSS